MHAIQYQRILDSLIYTAKATRPGIAQGVAPLAKFNSSLTEAPWPEMTDIINILLYP